MDRLLEDHLHRIHEIARRHGVRRLRIFGSRARGDATAGSDIDLLVEFEPGRSLLDHAALELELEELLGRPVDVVSERALSPYRAVL